MRKKTYKYPTIVLNIALVSVLVSALGQNLHPLVFAQPINVHPDMPDQFSPFGLEAGKYEVVVSGFRYVDRSREYGTSDGSNSKKRKIFGLVWAPRNEGTTRNLSRETYPDLYAKVDPNFSASEYKENWTKRGASETIVNEIIDATKIAVVEDANLEAEGPIVIAYPGFGSSPFDNAVLYEFLACHGIIVVSLSHQGEHYLGPDLLPADMEAAVKDIEFLAKHVLKMPENPDRFVGLMGHSWGGLLGYLVAARNPDFEALVTFDGTWSAANYVPAALEVTTEQELDSMSVPLLAYVAAAYHQDYSFVKRKKYRPTVLGKSWFMGHPHFTSVGVFFMSFALRDGVTSLKDFDETEIVRAYGAMCRTTLQFLGAAQQGNDRTSFSAVFDAMRADESFSYAIAQGEQPIPSQETFERMLQTDDFELAVRIFHRAILLGQSGKLFDEELGIKLTDKYLRDGQTQKARMMCGMVAMAFPNSADASYSQGSYFEATGSQHLASRFYGEALEKDSNHGNAKAALTRLYGVPNDPAYLKDLKESYNLAGEKWKFSYQDGLLKVFIPNDGNYILIPLGDKEFDFPGWPGYHLKFYTDETETIITKIEYTDPDQTQELAIK
jgi:pimeloyl-ACP methyl ester carboxylesterase